MKRPGAVGSGNTAPLPTKKNNNNNKKKRIMVGPGPIHKHNQQFWARLCEMERVELSV